MASDLIFPKQRLWIKLGGRDSEKYEAVRNEYHKTVVHIGEHHRMKQCRHGLFMLTTMILGLVAA